GGSLRAGEVAAQAGCGAHRAPLPPAEGRRHPGTGRTLGDVDHVPGFLTVISLQYTLPTLACFKHHGAKLRAAKHATCHPSFLKVCLASLGAPDRRSTTST